MFAVCAITLLCLTSVSCTVLPACKNLVQPFDQLDPKDKEGRWAMVADSLKIIQSVEPSELSDSISVDFYNSTVSISNRFGDQCDYFTHNVSIEGPHYNVMVGEMFKITGTIFRTNCSDCMLLSFKVDSPHFKSEELCLFSKRRSVDEKVLKEFISVVECLKMPSHIVMDPNQELCPACFGSHC